MQQSAYNGYFQYFICFSAGTKQTEEKCSNSVRRIQAYLRIFHFLDSLPFKGKLDLGAHQNHQDQLQGSRKRMV